MPRIAEPPPRPLATLFGIAVAITAAWCAVAVYDASLRLRNPADETPWNEVLYSELFDDLLWAIFTPIVVTAAERISLPRGRIVRNLLALIALIALLGSIRTIGHGTLPMLQYNVFVVAIIVFITKLMDVYRDADASDRHALALEAAVANAEAEHLRAQTQPSLLFGTLNAIRDQVLSDPAAADAMLVALGELLRRRLDQSAGTLVTLEEELIATERYLELLRVPYQFNIEDQALNALVPPFVLQTLLGTAIGDARPTSVSLHGSIRGNEIALEAHASPVDTTSATLTSAREQLQLRFGSGRIRTSGSTMIAFVDLRLQYANDAAYDPARTDRRG